MINNGISIGIINPSTDNGGGGEPQSLDQVLTVGDRPIKIVNKAYENVYNENFFDLIETDRAEHIFVDIEMNAVLNFGIFPLKTELLISNIAAANSFLNTGENINLQFAGQTYFDSQTIFIPAGSKAILKFLKTNGVQESWSVTFEFSSVPTQALNYVLNAGDRAWWNYVNFPLTGNITLTAPSRSRALVLTNENLSNDIIIFISDGGLTGMGAEYKVSNASDHNVSLRAIEGVELLGSSFDIPKNATAIIKHIKQVTNTGTYNNRTFFVSYELQEKQEAIYYIGGQDETGFLDIVEKSNNTNINFSFTRVKEGRIEIPEFNPLEYYIEHICYFENKLVGFNNDFEINNVNIYTKEIDGTDTDYAFVFGGIIKIIKF